MGLEDLEQFVSQESDRVKQSSALTESLSRGSQHNPDEYAKALATAARTGVSPTWAKEFGGDIERRLKVDPLSIDDLVRSNPKTAKFISQPDNAAIVHDDIDNLKKHEALFGIMGEDWLGRYKAASDNERFRLLTQARASVSRATPEKLKELGAKSRDVGEESFAGRAIGAFGAGVAGIGGNIVYPALQLGAELQSEIIGKPLVATGLLKRDPFAGMVEETTRWRKTFDEYIKSIGGPRLSDDLLSSSVLSGFQSAGANIPTMAAAVVAAPAVGIRAAANYSLNLMGAGTAGQAFGQGRDQGVGTFESVPFAVSQGIVEKYTEKLPATKLLEGLGLNQGWKGALRLFGSQLFHENWTEQVATHLQDLNEWAILPANKDKTVADYLSQRPSAALQTLIATTVGSVLQTGAAKGIDTAINNAERQRNKLFFEALGESATAAKLRQRMPDRYRDFIDQAAKDGPVEKIRIPVERFKEYFQSQDMNPATVAGEIGANNYQEAILGGLDVEVPLGQFAEKIAPTPHLGGLMPDLRIGDGLTDRESRERAAQVDSQREVFTERMAALVQEQENIAPIDVAIQEIVGETEAQLIAAGTEKNTARDQATLMRGIAVLAHRAFPELDALDAARQLWSHYGLVIERPGQGFEERQRVLDAFTSDPEFRGNFDEMLELVRAGQFDETRAPSVAELANKLYAVRNKSGKTSRQVGAIKVQPEIAAHDKALQADADAAAQAAQAPDDVPFDVPAAADGAQFREQAGQLAAYLKSAGIDVAGLSNDQVFEAVRREAGTTLFQSDDTKAPPQIEFEVAPDPRERAAVAAWEELSPLDRFPVTREVASQIAPLALKQFGTDGELFEQLGGWDGKTSPSLALTVEDSKAAVKVGKLLGYALSQEAVFVVSERPAPGLEKKGAVQIVLPAGFGEDAVRALYAKLFELEKDGAKLIQGHSTYAGRMFIVNTSDGVSIDELGQMISDHLNGQFEVSGYEVYAALLRKGDDDYGLQTPGSRSRRQSAETRRADHLRAQANQALRDAIAKRIPGGGRKLFQADDDAKKLGYTKLLESGKIKIGLLEGANLSTFLHETGHLYLEVLGDLAAIPYASQQVKDDYAAILNFLKVESRDQIQTEHHEKFARANEVYLMEGKAPAAELRPVFQRFRAWLKFIYERLTHGELTTQIDENLRGVMDRIYATDAEIMRATQELGSVQMIATAELVGWSREEFDLYAKAVAEEVESAKEDLQQKLLAEYAREQKKAWRDELKKVREQVTEASDVMPVYLAFNDLTRGTMLAGEPVKLNSHALRLRYGANILDALPKSVHAEDGNLDADTAASFFGFNNGEELLQALSAMVPQAKYIAARAKQIMAERHGDIIVDGNIGREAMSAMHNEQRLKVLRMELRALRAKVREVEPFIEPLREEIKQGEKERAYENRFRAAEDAERRARARAATEVAPPAFYRDTAKQAIDGAAPRDIIPSKYVRASQKASRAAFKALAKGDYIEAAIQKQQELINHYLFLEAAKAREEIDKILRFAKSFDRGATREAMAAAQIGGGNYLGQIDNILNRYEFRKTPLVEIDRREGLAQWIESERAAGREPVIDAVLLDESRKVNYQNVPMTELRSVYDALRNIEHLARRKNQLAYKKKQIEFGKAKNQLITAAVNNLGQVMPGYSDSAAPRSAAVKKWLQSLDAGFIKVEQLMMWLDGNDVQGPWHTYIWNPLKEAQHELDDDMKKTVDQIAQLATKMPKAWRASLYDLVQLDPTDITRTRKDLIGIALNTGNAENYRHAVYSLEDRDNAGNVIGGGPERLDRAKARLTADDWRFVQEVWDLIETMKPKIGAVQERLTGLAPEWVEPVPFQVRDPEGNIHSLRGGYYPLVADRYERVGGLQQADIFEESYLYTNTSHGFTKKRTKAEYSLDFNFERILSHHVAQVIKDYSHREAVLAANQILLDKDIKTTLATTLGEKYEPLFHQWLKDIANETNRSIVEGLDSWSSTFTATRANLVAATLGFKATTAIMQLSSLMVSTDRVKSKYLSKALLDYIKHPLETTRRTWEISGELRNRSNNLDRDIRARLAALAGRSGLVAQAQRFGFHGIAVADGITAVITWQGAYNQAMDQGVTDPEEAVLEADAAVRLTQGAGSVMDQAAIQRSRDEFRRALTMFYSFQSAQYAMGRDIIHDVEAAKDFPRALARYFVAMLAPILLADLIVLRGPDGDDDEQRLGYLTWALRKALLAPFATVPFFRDVANAVDFGIDRGQSRGDMRFTPLFTAMEKAGKLGARVASDAANDRDIDWAEYAGSTAEVVGYAFGFPGTAQISASIRYQSRLNQGTQQAPDNLAWWLYELGIGKPKGK